jgi:hypothetical protein
LWPFGVNLKGVISNGAGTLSVNVVNGTAIFDGVNTYSKGTTISGAGTSVFGNTTTAFGSGAVTMSAGNVYLSSSLNIGALSGTGGSIVRLFRQIRSKVGSLGITPQCKG